MWVFSPWPEGACAAEPRGAAGPRPRGAAGPRPARRSRNPRRSRGMAAAAAAAAAVAAASWGACVIRRCGNTATAHPRVSVSSTARGSSRICRNRVLSALPSTHLHGESRTCGRGGQRHRQRHHLGPAASGDHRLGRLRRCRRRGRRRRKRRRRRLQKCHVADVVQLPHR